VLIQGLILEYPRATNPSALAQIILIDQQMGVDYAAVRAPSSHPGRDLSFDQTRARDEFGAFWLAEMETSL